MWTAQRLAHLGWLLPLLLAAAALAAVMYRDPLWSPASTYERRQVLGGPALPLRYESGFAYVADLSRAGHSEAALLSKPFVLEEGRPLAARNERRRVRRIPGSYLESEGLVYLSARDGSDPRTNGRRYELVYRQAYFPGFYDTLRLYSLALAAMLAAIVNAVVRLSIHRQHPPPGREGRRRADLARATCMR